MIGRFIDPKARCRFASERRYRTSRNALRFGMFEAEFAAAFAGSDDTAVVDGDFAMLESELQDVLKTLRRSGISIVAIHSHMAHEEPRILFLHYWGLGRTEDLARGLRAALDRTHHDGERHP